MGSNGYASVTLSDGGGANIIVPSTQLQFVMGCSVGGTAAAGAIVSTQNPATLQTNGGWGPGVEGGGLTALAGGTVLYYRTPITTHGTATAVTFTGTGTSVITVTLDSTNGAWDSYLVQFTCTSGGTIATGPISFTISLDANRTVSGQISLGTATTYVIPNTGITLNFATGSLVTGDIAQFSTQEPLPSTAAYTAGLAALMASPYGQQGIGSVNCVGKLTGAQASTIGGNLVSIAAQTLPDYLYMINGARDAIIPTTWGGAGETEATWMAAILSDYSAIGSPNGDRVAAAAGHYNMPSAYINGPLGIAPAFRRSLSWGLACRVVQIPIQQSAGRVKSGNISQIIVNPITQNTDGFVYHNEAVNPGLAAGRFTAATTRMRKQGYYILTDNNMATTGSQINSRPLIAVADTAETILEELSDFEINDNVRLLPNGTMDPRDQATIGGLLNGPEGLGQMTSAGNISSSTVTLNPTDNVQLTGAQTYVATVTSRGIILQLNGTLQFSNPNQAQ
jgi:hypothetical protein